MSTLKESIEQAFKKSAGMLPTDNNPNIEQLSTDLAKAVQDWLLKQEFRIDEMEIPLDVEKITTNGPIKNNVAPETLMGPYGPVIKFLKDVASFAGLSSQVSKIEGLIMKACKKVSEGGSETPALDLRKTATKVGNQPALQVDGNAVFSSNSSPSQKKPSGVAKKTKVRLYPGEVKDTGD
tara:strand:+ start:72 stop:611 length:540 start_codon:yes stop_codon:yes gene_type:complete